MLAALISPHEVDTHADTSVFDVKKNLSSSNVIGLEEHLVTKLNF